MKKNNERLVKAFENLCNINFSEDGGYSSKMPSQKDNSSNESRVLREMATILDKLSKNYPRGYEKAVNFLPNGYRSVFDSMEDRIKIEKIRTKKRTK